MFNKTNKEIELAQKLINYSCKIKKDEKVLISYSDTPDRFIEILIEEIYKVGAIPVVYRLDKKIKRKLMLGASSKIFEYFKKIVAPIMNSCDSVILIGGSMNDYELSDVPPETFANFSKLYNEPIHFNIRCKKKWVLLRYPTYSFAQSSRLSSEKFAEFFFDVCTLDYNELDRNMTPLKQLMEKTDKVKIITPNTNLEFSIKDMPVIKCTGQNNIPDGEIYTAPIKDSVNGTIVFNIPATDNGIQFNGISLTFKDGKITDFDCNNKNDFETILNSDEGSRYLGEFAFGLNTHCTTPIHDILFDEKMISSIHLAIGSSYEDCFNGNTSSIHLDLIQSHLPKYGGGKIYFDNQLIYENGLFTLPNLVALNAENLL